MEGKMQIEIEPQDLKLILAALAVVTPSGGGSPLHNTSLKLAAFSEAEPDFQLYAKLVGNVIMEMEQQLEDEAESQQLRALAKKAGYVEFAHPYDCK
jgi:hypothetical protein